MPALKKAELIEGVVQPEKLQVYRRNGVREYVVWRVLDSQVDWFVLHAGRYESMTLSVDGLYRSTVFPGLWLDPVALLNHDLARVIAVVQEGLKTVEHAGFVARLEQARTKTGAHAPCPIDPR
jgi:hypothetical protein